MSTPVATRPEAVTLGAAAARLGVHRATLRAAIERGDIPATRLGRSWLVPIAVLDGLLAASPDAKDAPS
jgi:excisionase family DNA binding protein